MNRQTKRAFRFHPNFRECTRCLRIVRKELYGWHRDGWQYADCPDCFKIRWKSYDKRPKSPNDWTPDEKTILTLAHAHGHTPKWVAQRLNRTLLAVKTHAWYMELGPWAYSATSRRQGGTKSWRALSRVASGESLLGQSDEGSSGPRSAAG